MKTRLFGMLLTGMALALAVLILIEIVPPLSNLLSKNDPAINAGAGETDLDRSIAPPIFTSVAETDGSLSIEGTGEPEAAVSLFKNGEPLSQVSANADGEWAAVLDVNAVLGQMQTAAIDAVLETEAGDRIRGDETIIRVRVPDDMDAAPPRALVLVTAPGGPSRIIQNPYRGDPEDGALSIGPIDYDDSGGVIFSGRSRIPGRVRIYGNGEMIGETQISSAGRWFFIAADTVPEGPYNVGAELATSNGVLSRVDLALTRMPPMSKSDALSAAPTVSIQDNIWQVRRILAGGGAQYTAVFNPDNLTEPK